MAISHKGDIVIENTLTSKNKALKINLNTNIYGTFSEIGAGQETVRHFFRAGGSSGTIAKAMSAYDKDFSDAIYGIGEHKRYVTETRLKKMLHHETQLIEDRLDRNKHPDKMYFSYAAKRRGGGGTYAPPPSRLLISNVLVLNCFTSEGQMRKLSDIFRIKLI